MGVKPLLLGDLDSVLSEPQAGLTCPSDWSQEDSDVIAHFIQVQSQIASSRWMKSNCSFTLCGDELADQDFPTLEDFVFAAVYLRQFIAKKDDLFSDAVKRYCLAVDCRSRGAWMDFELNQFHSKLNNDSFRLKGYSVRQLFDAFMYGAGILHKFPKKDAGNKKRMLELIDEKPRHEVLYALHMSLRMATNHTMRASALMRRDFGNWLSEYSLPRPNVRWHYSLLTPKSD